MENYIPTRYGGERKAGCFVGLAKSLANQTQAGTEDFWFTRWHVIYKLQWP